MKIKFNVNRTEHINVGNYSFVEIGLTTQASGDFDSASSDDAKIFIKELSEVTKKFCDAERKVVEKLIKANTWSERK